MINRQLWFNRALHGVLKQGRLCVGLLPDGKIGTCMNVDPNDPDCHCNIAHNFPKDFWNEDWRLSFFGKSMTVNMNIFDMGAEKLFGLEGFEDKAVYVSDDARTESDSDFIYNLRSTHDNSSHGPVENHMEQYKIKMKKFAEQYDLEYNETP